MPDTNNKPATKSADKTTQPPYLEKVSSYTTAAKGVILTLTSLIALIISTGGANFKNILGDDFSPGRAFIIIFTVLLSMALAYLIGWIYRSPDEVIKKIFNVGKNNNIYALIASIGAGFFMFMFATTWSPNSEWDGLFRSSLVIGLLAGVLFGIFLLIAFNLFLTKGLEPLNGAIDPLGKWGKLLFCSAIALLLAAIITDNELVAIVDFDAIGRVPLVGEPIAKYTHYAYYIVGGGVFAIALVGLYVLSWLSNAAYKHRKKLISKSSTDNSKKRKLKK